MCKLKANFLGGEEHLLSCMKNYIKRTEPEFQGDLEEEAIERINEHAYTDSSDAPAVYIGSYHKYNCGSVYGLWANLASFDAYEEFLEFCKAIHSDENDVEPMLQDYEGFPRQWYCESGIGEHFDDIKEFSELDSEDRDIVETWIDMGHDWQDWQEHYQGKWDSEEDFAEYLFDEIYGDSVPEFLQNYIDYGRFSRDIFCGDYTFENGYVFSCN